MMPNNTEKVLSEMGRNQRFPATQRMLPTPPTGFEYTAVWMPARRKKRQLPTRKQTREAIRRAEAMRRTPIIPSGSGVIK